MTGSFIDLVRTGGPLEAFGYSAGERAELLRTCADLLPVDVAVAVDASLGGHAVSGPSFVELVANAPLAPPPSPELGRPADWHDAWPPAPLGHDVADLADLADPAGAGDGSTAQDAGDHGPYDDDFGHGARSGDLHERHVHDASDGPTHAHDVPDPVQEQGGRNEDAPLGELDVRLHGLEPTHEDHDTTQDGEDHHGGAWWDDDDPG